MITTRLEWEGDQRAGEVELITRAMIQRATVFLWTKIVEALNVPNTGVRKKHRSKKTKSGRAASYTVYPHPSKPGEAPRKRTGWLQRNLKWEVDEEGVGRVGVVANAKYGLYLELGTSRMKPRPFLLATLQAHFSAVQALVKGMVT